MTIHDVEQGSEDWLALRLGKFTASEGHTIATNKVGLDTLCFKKAAEVKTGKAKESYTNFDMDRGVELEEMARNSYEIETGIVVKRLGFVELSEWVGCSPDGTIDTDGLQEIKCKDDANFAKFAYSREIDKDHYGQMQMQMYIMDRKWCDYVVFNPNFDNNIIIERVKRDEEYIEKIRIGLERGIELTQKIIEKI